MVVWELSVGGVEIENMKGPSTAGEGLTWAAAHAAKQRSAATHPNTGLLKRISILSAIRVRFVSAKRSWEAKTAKHRDVT